MLTIPSLYNGPPTSAHGGVAAGHMAALVDPARAVIRFHSPPPLDDALREVHHPSGSVDLFDGSRRVATVSPSAALNVEPFEQLDPVAVWLAESRWLDHADGHHPFPTCFGCGPDRAHDGLALEPGSVVGTDMHATSWTPDVTGIVPLWLVWAAIDCPSGAPALRLAPGGSAAVTGELAVEVRAPIVGGDRYQILSRSVGSTGRKIFTHAAIVDPSGRNVAVAEATWIVVPAEAAVAS